MPYISIKRTFKHDQRDLEKGQDYFQVMPKTRNIKGGKRNPQL
jgi:hypothetical protein